MGVRMIMAILKVIEMEMVIVSSRAPVPGVVLGTVV